MRPLFADGGALVGDFLRFGRGQLAWTIVLMIVADFLDIGHALLMPIFSPLAPQAGSRWQQMVIDTLAGFGLATRMEQLAAVLVALCALVRCALVRCTLVVAGALAACAHRTHPVERVHPVGSAFSILLRATMAGIIFGVKTILLIVLSSEIAA